MNKRWFISCALLLLLTLALNAAIPTPSTAGVLSSNPGQEKKESPGQQKKNDPGGETELNATARKPGGGSTTPTVYVVIAVDTENSDWSWFPGQPLANDPNPLFDTTNYKRSSYMAKLFNSTFRNSYKDSFGGIFKMSWFAQMDPQFQAATYKDEGPEFSSLSGTPVGFAGVMDTLKRYWGSQIQQYGDGIFWHHHVEKWNGKAWVGGNEAIDGYTGHYDTLNHLIIDRSYYPSTFRSGWCWEDSTFSRFLEQWIPLDLSSLRGDWKPFHPNINDPFSSAAPNMERWMTRSDSLTDAASVNAAFNQAQKQGKALYSFFIHERDDMPWFVNNVHSLLTSAAKRYRGVKFKYVTAQEAMQAMLGYTDRAAPQLSLTPVDSSTYQIASNEVVWKSTPYVTAKYAAGSDEYYGRIDASASGDRKWKATIPQQKVISPPAPEPTEHYPVSSSASNSWTSDYGPDKAYDGNTGTFWDSSTATFPQWIKLDLVAESPISKMTILFWDSPTEYRTYSYYVEASVDGTSWSRIVDNATVEGLATHQFSSPVTAKHIRITVTGSNVTLYAHICEAHLYGSTPDVPAPAPITLPLVKVGAAGSDLQGNPGVATLAAAVPSVMTSASSFDIRATYDQKKAVKDGIQVTVQVVNSGGANMSSKNLGVTAVGLSPSGLPSDAGKLNPGNKFRYHNKGAKGGEYSYSLNTKGLKPGSYELELKVAGSDKTHKVKFNVK